MSIDNGDYQNTGLALHIIFPLPCNQENVTVLFGLTPRGDHFLTQKVASPETNVSTMSAAPALVESTGYQPRWTQIDDNAVEKLATKLARTVLPMLSQQLNVTIPIFDLINASVSPVASTYLKMSCEQHKLVDYYEDRTTRWMKMPSFGATDLSASSITSAASELTVTDLTGKHGLAFDFRGCPICGHVTGKYTLIKVVEFTIKHLKQHGVEIITEPLLDIVKPEAKRSKYVEK